MWSYCNPVDKSLFFFEYQRGRGNKHARPGLQDFKGYPYTDAYFVYKHYGSLQGVTYVNCNAHVRRKFHEAKFADRKRAEHALMEQTFYGWLKRYGSKSAEEPKDPSMAPGALPA